MKIQKVSIDNFKGIRKLDIDFYDTTRIRAPNGGGKTSIGDAISWVLTNSAKNSRHL